jgi:arylsulfatase A-like enzyme
MLQGVGVAMSRVRCALPLHLLAFVLVGCGEPPLEGRGQPNVLLIVVDTLRADHLHSYGYPRRTSGNVDALASQGWVFQNHIASAAQTVPSTLSMMLSLHPPEHGFRHPSNGYFAKNPPLYPDRLLFLAEVYSEAGFATAGFVGNPFLRRANGFAQGFDEFFYSEEAGDRLTAAASRWLEEHVRSPRPFFVYLHYFDVHWPYSPPPAYWGRFEVPEGGRLVYRNGPVNGVDEKDLLASIAMYDSAIAFVDDEIGKLLRTLEELGVRDNTVIAVTSDHGEEFLDHGGLGHGTTVYGELVRVPLVLVHEGRLEPGRAIEALTHHIDLAPTLLQLSGVPAPEGFRGRPLPAPAERAFSEDGPWRAVYSNERKLVINKTTDSHEIFDVRDERDQHALPDEVGTAGLSADLDWYDALERVTPASDARSTAEWSDVEMDRLRALGYLE